MAVLGLCYYKGFSLVAMSGATLPCGAGASHRCGFSCFGAQALGCPGFSSCSSRGPEHRLNSCGPQA